MELHEDTIYTFKLSGKEIINLVSELSFVLDGDLCLSADERKNIGFLESMKNQIIDSFPGIM